MITLITGLPGSAKTLLALQWVQLQAEKEGRAVYYSEMARGKLGRIVRAGKKLGIGVIGEALRS